MSDIRPQAPGLLLPLVGLLEALIMMGLALKPSRYRAMSFVPIALILCWVMSLSRTYTMTGTIQDHTLGGFIFFHTLYGLDGIVLTDVQRKLYCTGDKPGGIILEPFVKRLAWAVHFFASPRGVGWAHELRSLPQNPISHNNSRAAFLLSRLLTLGTSVLITLSLMALCTVDPALAHGATVEANQGLPRRAVVGVLGLVASCTSTNGLHCILSIVFVGVGISKPADWPPLFGPVAMTYSLQTFWGVFWHQLLRQPFVTISNFILQRIFPNYSTSARPTILFRLLQLHLVFILSGLMHMGGEYIALGYLSTNFFYFMSLQAWGITAEMAIRYLLGGSIRSSGKDKPKLIWRLIGYVWVVCWFTALAPLMHESCLKEGGLFHGMAIPEFIQRR